MIYYNIKLFKKFLKKFFRVFKTKIFSLDFKT
ncbi:hypothetical protein [Campylobacter phage CJLB-12]|nr:hypothetical protein [Campylobacter phage CJLB-12]